ncbi:unnamed protein product [Adineta steineri]|uniref:Uncharacterized protein n=1 Tax=Adineta steineri TaxID=433720 RepID=A0A814MYY7_9BILA|nr:unnamed protein product [Adineta steineri]CAF1135242.1 unnamed protein product [Adineta steineri]CAF1163430.1 unnamed protein product [Adineta steineri]
MPPLHNPKGLIGCPYRKVFEDNMKKMEEFKLLRLITECFGFYRTKILISELKKINSNNSASVKLESSEDCMKLYNKTLVQGATQIGISKAAYTALHDLLLRRNSLCHPGPISRKNVNELKTRTKEFRIFQKGQQDESVYPSAAMKLADKLLALPDESFLSEKDFVLTNFRQS